MDRPGRRSSMRCRIALWATLSGVAVGIPVAIAPAAAGDAPKTAEWISLWSGKDLAGWETCLGIPVGEKNPPIGRNKDPKKVFQVVQLDGEPALRISGEMLGGLATLQEFDNYLLELEFKWGEK